jgi:hypothetical protein
MEVEETKKDQQPGDFPPHKNTPLRRVPRPARLKMFCRGYFDYLGATPPNRLQSGWGTYPCVARSFSFCPDIRDNVDMNYWLVKGRPQENDFASFMKLGKIDHWYTGRPPKRWSEGDRLFFGAVPRPAKSSV